MSTRDAEPVVFSRSFTGYNRQQVGDYVMNLRQYVAQFELRAVEAESLVKSRETDLADAQRRLSAARTSDVPARLQRILEIAHEEAEGIREGARVEASKVTEQAAREADVLLADATARLADVEQQIKRLSTIRENYLGDLRSLGFRITQTMETYGEDEVDRDDQSDDHLAETQELAHEPPAQQVAAGAEAAR